MTKAKWSYPLPGKYRIWPDRKGEFAYQRRFHTHEGIDLYAPVGTPVMACEAGEVVSVIEFTGFEESPHWNDTYAVLIEGESGVICYGEVIPYNVKVGDKIEPGTVVGFVAQVLKTYKGRPMSMLHLELLKLGSKDSVSWPVNSPKPDILLDPTMFLYESFLSGSDDIRRMKYVEPVRF